MGDIYICNHMETGDTSAIQNAIDRCSQSGGGSVILENGTYICGTLYLKSNINLVIRESAVLKASGDITQYGTDTHYNRYRNEKALDRCFIYAGDQENISITGGGLILGSSEEFPNEGSIYRPMMLRFLRCRNIRITDIRLFDAAAWTTAFLDSQWIYLNRVQIHNEKRYNGDGIDLDGCSHVFISDCGIKGTDDNLCLQSSSSQYPVEDIHITNCSFTSLCAGIRIGLKSIGIIRNVTVSGCTMHDVWREGIKIECTEGGSITDILISNIVMRNVSRPVFLLLNNRFAPEDYGSSVELDHIPDIGVMERICLSNIIAADDPEEMKKPHYRFGDDLMGAPWFNGIRVDAEEGHKMKGLTLDNIQYTAVGGVKKGDIPESYPLVIDQKKLSGQKCSENYYPDWSRAAFMDIRNVENLILSNVRFSSWEQDERPGYYLEGCSLLKKEIFLQK